MALMTEKDRPSAEIPKLIDEVTLWPVGEKIPVPVVLDPMNGFDRGTVTSSMAFNISSIHPGVVAVDFDDFNDFARDMVIYNVEIFYCYDACSFYVAIPEGHFIVVYLRQFTLLYQKDNKTLVHNIHSDLDRLVDNLLKGQRLALVAYTVFQHMHAVVQN